MSLVIDNYIDLRKTWRNKLRVWYVIYDTLLTLQGIVLKRARAPLEEEKNETSDNR